MSNKGKKCSNCTHSRKIDGIVNKDFSYTEDTFDCINPRVKVKFMDKYNWDQKLLAKRCRYYKPILIRECSYCGKKIKRPEYNWDIWAKSIFANLPVCSKSCKKEIQKEFSKEVEDSNPDEGFDEFNI